MKRLSYQYVKQYFEEKGCILLEETYVNSKTKMRYICSCGEKSEITFHDFWQGRRCRNCGDIASAHKRRKDIEYFRIFFKEKGCDLLENNYINNKTPMPYKCVCGRISEICFSSFAKGRRCKECGFEKNRGSNSGSWVADKTQSLFNAKLRRRYKNVLRNCLKYTGQKKCAKTQQMLGYSPKQFKERIFNHPNWEKVKDGKWHVDHIFPIKAFLDRKIHDMKIINSLDNLQPLSEEDNLKKWHSYDEEAFQVWLKNKGVA